MMLLPYYSLPNVIKGDFLVAEVLQKDMTVTNLTQELTLLLDKKKQKKLIKEFAQLHKSLLNPNNNATKAVMKFLNE